MCGARRTYTIIINRLEIEACSYPRYSGLGIMCVPVQSVNNFFWLVLKFNFLTTGVPPQDKIGQPRGVYAVL